MVFWVLTPIKVGMDIVHPCGPRYLSYYVSPDGDDYTIEIGESPPLTGAILLSELVMIESLMICDLFKAPGKMVTLQKGS